MNHKDEQGPLRAEGVLTGEQVAEYAKIIENAFGVKMTLVEARANATRYLHLLDVLADLEAKKRARPTEGQNEPRA